MFLLRNRSEVCTVEARNMLRVPDAFRATRSSGVDARYTSKQARPRGSAPGFPDDVFGENTKNRGDHSMAWGSGLNQPDQTPSSSGISIRRIRRWPCLHEWHATSRLPPIRIRVRVLSHSPHAAPSPCIYHERRQWTQNSSYRKSAPAFSRC